MDDAGADPRTVKGEKLRRKFGLAKCWKQVINIDKLMGCRAAMLTCHADRGSKTSKGNSRQNTLVRCWSLLFDFEKPTEGRTVMLTRVSTISRGSFPTDLRPFPSDCPEHMGVQSEPHDRSFPTKQTGPEFPEQNGSYGEMKLLSTLSRRSYRARQALLEQASCSSGRARQLNYPRKLTRETCPRTEQRRGTSTNN